MKLAGLAALLASLAFTASAPDVLGGGFSAKFIGENGDYKPRDPATDEFLEDSPRHADPAPPPSIAAPPPASERRETPAASAPRPTLWRGLARPLEMTPAQAGVADADEASDAGRRDYESHILGREELSRRPGLDGASAAPRTEPTAFGDEERRLFVSLELDPSEAGSLRDAIAGLGATVGFSADARFQPRSGPEGISMISGWMPASQLGFAALQPGVKRLRVETASRPTRMGEISGEFVVGLRLEGASPTREAVDAGVRALASTAGFRLTRVIGLETAPDGRAVAMISGLVPLSRLSKALGRPDVISVSPLSSAGGFADAPERVSRARRFARFVRERGLWLLLITLAMALPALRAAALRVLSVLVPYR